jgi:hypothetical protein
MNNGAKRHFDTGEARKDASGASPAVSDFAYATFVFGRICSII